VKFAEEAEALSKSHWPKCDELARSLASKGPQSIDALRAALKSRTHHVRSAALLALNSVDPIAGVACANELLKDRAFEVRETAAAILAKSPS
jgi:HEAT repeat protein